MSRRLPPQPSLHHLHNEAKSLLKAHRSKDPAVCPLLRRLRQFAQASDAEILAVEVTLAQVQYALAMDYGFDSWAALKGRVDRSAPPMRLAPTGRWYHGSSIRLDVLKAGSTVTPVPELARAFAHRPSRVEIRVHENDETNTRRLEIEGNGRRGGYLYEVEVADPQVDLEPLPGSTMAPGDEMLTTRDLPVRLIEELPQPTGRQEFIEPLSPKEAIMTPTPYQIQVFAPGDAIPPQMQQMFAAGLAESRAAVARSDPRGPWSFACTCAIDAGGNVLGGVHVDMGPINDGPLARDKVAVLERVYVRPEHRRRGIATALMNRAIELAGQAGCSHMRCNSRWDHPAEIALFRRCGFALTDIGEKGTNEYFTVRPLNTGSTSG
jgi:GNAT superfamily N-acetyltransferase